MEAYQYACSDLVLQSFEQEILTEIRPGLSGTCADSYPQHPAEIVLAVWHRYGEITFPGYLIDRFLPKFEKLHHYRDSERIQCENTKLKYGSLPLDLIYSNFQNFLPSEEHSIPTIRKREG